MNLDITQFAGSYLFFPMVFVLGLLGGLVSCAVLEVPFITAVITTTEHTRRQVLYKTVVFLIGMLTSYVVIGFFITKVSRFFTQNLSSTKWLFIALGLIALVWGLRLIWKNPEKCDCAYHHHAHASIADHHVCEHDHCASHHDHNHAHSPYEFLLKWVRPTSYPAIFLIGNLFSWLETPLCPGCGPILYLLAMLTILKGNVLTGIATFAIYAIGQGIPVLIIVMGFARWFESPFIVKNKEHVQLFMSNVLVFAGGVLLWLS